MTTIAKERLLNLDASPLPARDEPNTNVPRWVLRAIVMGDMIIIIVLSYLYIQNGGTHGAAGQIAWLSGGLGIHLIFAPILYIVIGIITVNDAITDSRRRKRQSEYIAAFATINQLDFRQHLLVNSQKGLLFQQSNHPITNVISIERTNISAQIGTLTRRINRTLYPLGYLRVRLGEQQPHVLLDLKKNNLPLGNLPVGFSQSRPLQLEGPFGDYFAAHYIEGTHVETLSILTPDVMALLINNCTKYDIEIVDNYLYFYWDGVISLLNKASIAELEDIIDTLGRKLLAKGNTERQTEQQDIRLIHKLQPLFLATEGIFYILAACGISALLWALMN